MILRLRPPSIVNLPGRVPSLAQDEQTALATGNWQLGTRQLLYSREAMSARTEPISVEIYGQTYNVRGDGDSAYLTELAQFVDSRMRAVSSQVPSNDPVRIAILAALNIADEYTRYRNERESTRGFWMEKTEELARRLELAAGSQTRES